MQGAIERDERHPAMGAKSIVGCGRQSETYRPCDGAWRIAKLTLTRLRLDTVTAEQEDAS